jgi:hypothetical protein
MQSIRLLDGHLGNLTTCDPGLGMIKSELIGRIASQNPHLYQRDIENIVNENPRGASDGTVTTLRPPLGDALTNAAANVCFRG